VNRLAGALANPTPATQVAAIVKEIPKALVSVLEEIAKDGDGRCAAKKYA
jgi:hypothetical protein